MSAYKKIECEIVDKDCLLEALKLLGFEPEVFVEPKNLTGFKGDERKETANIIISKLQNYIEPDFSTILDSSVVLSTKHLVHVPCGLRLHYGILPYLFSCR